MTVIAAKKTESGIVFAADSIVTAGALRVTDRSMQNGKLFAQNNMLIGGTGRSSENQLLFLFTRNHKPVSATLDGVIDFMVEFCSWGKGKDSSFQPENQYLIAFEKNLYRTYSGTLEVFEVEEFDAIGAGQDFALAALHLGHSPKEAIEVACELSIFCALPVQERTHETSAE